MADRDVTGLGLGLGQPQRGPLEVGGGLPVPEFVLQVGACVDNAMGFRCSTGCERSYGCRIDRLTPPLIIGQIVEQVFLKSHTRMNFAGHKRRAYAGAGIPFYLLVDR